ncbi:MAG: hypothetical protein AAB929_06190 [Patescibacteria group bacterium]
MALVMVLGVFVFFPLFSFGQNAPVVFVDDLSLVAEMERHPICRDVIILIDAHFPAEYRVKVRQGIGFPHFLYISYHGQLLLTNKLYYFYNSTAHDACAIIKRHFYDNK